MPDSTPKSSIKVRREAAHSMREHHPISHPRHDMWRHLSLLLELDALQIQLHIPQAGRISDRHQALSTHIGNVAKAYLSAVPRPDIGEEL